jgi:large subunit ribosomal protein L15
MQLNQLRTIHKSKNRKRVGRGGKRGTYSGRGMKGQKARAGRKIRPEIRDLIKKLPKLRGCRFKVFKTKPAVLNLADLEKHFENGTEITPGILAKLGLVEKKGGKLPAVKILGSGEIKKKLIVEGCRISKAAKEKLEKTGGIIKGFVQKSEPKGE